MSHTVLVIDDETTLRHFLRLNLQEQGYQVTEAADVMVEKDVKKLPVVYGGKLLGIVTSMDLVEAEPEMIKNIADLFTVAKKKKSVAG